MREVRIITSNELIHTQERGLPSVLSSTAGVLSSGIRSRGSEKLPCEMSLLRRHHPRLLARFDLAPPPRRCGPLTTSLPMLEGSRASSSFESHNRKPKSTCCWEHSDGRRTELTGDERCPSESFACHVTPWRVAPRAVA